MAVPEVHPPTLATRARNLLQTRRDLAKIMPKGLFRDSGWDILLELYAADAEGGVVYVKQMVIASGEHGATAIRIIDRLEQGGLLQRAEDKADSRRIILSLTSDGRRAIELVLSEL
ncbi:hypothetical protein GRI97_11025 [Altererythrobacter xixiisoli]|uniref:HTH marR-type domain-containing protein n=1 Tax=Croceibacterium xixiisoli TaxID=1476466 RepID=A0A6I4TWM3_9SPHN|nr:hypothetical protein [Croceibacterium xixiisoli]MXO99521.1 hypothetical protein [Croceibacterium xixiisoli]